MSNTSLSFLPDDYLERKVQRRTNAICGVLFLIVMCAIAAAFTITERSTRSIEQVYEAKLKEYTEEAKRIEQAEQMRDKQKIMTRQAELAAALLEKVPRSNILADITNNKPPGVALLEFKLESKARAGAAKKSGTAVDQKKVIANDKAATPAAEAKVYDVGFKIVGIASTDVEVAAFITMLNGSKLLTDVNLVISDSFAQDGMTLRRFQIDAALDPTAQIDAPPAEKKTVAATELKPE